MGKVLLFLSLASIMFLGVGTHIAPYSSLFLLASDADNFQRVRFLIGIILAIQLFTRPPRHVWFRVVAGSLAVFTGLWAMEMTWNYHMQLLDSFAFLGAAFGIFATSLERNLNEVPAVVVKGKLIV